MAKTNGRIIAQTQDDPGIGLSSLGCWKWIYRKTGVVARPHEDVIIELARARKKLELLRPERDWLKSP